MRGMFQVKLNIDPVQKITMRRGLEKNGSAQKFFTHEVRRLSDPYVPYRSGMLKNTAVEEPDKITYVQPYAKKQWFTNKGKSGPLRGKFWCIRMWNDRGDEITKSVANYVGGRAK